MVTTISARPIAEPNSALKNSVLAGQLHAPKRIFSKSYDADIKESCEPIPKYITFLLWWQSSTRHPCGIAAAEICLMRWQPWRSCLEHHSMAKTHIFCSLLCPSSRQQKEQGTFAENQKFKPVTCDKWHQKDGYFSHSSHGVLLEQAGGTFASDSVQTLLQAGHCWRWTKRWRMHSALKGALLDLFLRTGTWEDGSFSVSVEQVDWCSKRIHSSVCGTWLPSGHETCPETSTETR